MNNNWIEQFKAARRSGAPIVVIRTSDYSSVIQEINRFYSEKEVPILNWDICRGIMGINKNGEDAARLVNKPADPAMGEQSPEMVTGNPVEALQKGLKYLPVKEFNAKGEITKYGAICFFQNLQIIIESRDDNRIAVIQGIWNCRDQFKATGRTMVLLVPEIKVPSELANDVVVLDTQLPTQEELGEIVKGTFKSAGLPAPGVEIVTSAVDSISGLSEFSAEQVTAMSISKEGLDLEAMWTRKRSIIQQTGGLSVETRKVSFDDLGGLDQIKKFARLIINGKKRPKLVVLIDEIDRQLSGVNDSSGVGGDAYQQVLSNMQDRNWSGMLFPGIAGTGKTEMAHAIGCEAGGLFIKLDLGGMQDKFVGESQKKIRSAMQTLWAIGGENVLFVGTTNRAEAIRPELKRRFSKGTFFFDSLNTLQQTPIWVIYLAKYDLPEQKLPKCTGWTGAEIRSCCAHADELGISLVEAAVFITPVVKTMGEELTALRKSANGKYLSASTEGFYTMAGSADADVEAAQDEIINL